MILYTVIPEEFVLAGLDHPDLKGGTTPELQMQARGRSGPIKLLLEQNPGGGWRIGRLLSSDPLDFLDPAFAPGSSYSPTPPGPDTPV